MTESYSGNACEQMPPLETRESVPQSGREAISHFPAGALLETQLLRCEDVLLSGWVGLGRPHTSADDLIGVLLPGDRLGAVLDSHLCCAVALTPVSVAPEDYRTDEAREFRHLIRQCVRTCHFSAWDRIEDFFLETYERLEAVELASDWTFDLPLSQATIARILGLSTAHVNRIIHQLRAQHHIKIAGRAITLLTHNALGSLPMESCVI
ncbi:MAG TPA: helix-turn-helix domain-containing protein [Rhizomicrobium sp.]|nr:helix-turn-helix domain-containing protein [Rhizomicrobium sp.]